MGKGEKGPWKGFGNCGLEGAFLGKKGFFIPGGLKKGLIWRESLTRALGRGFLGQGFGKKGPFWEVWALGRVMVN